MIRDSECERYRKELASQLTSIIENSAIADAGIRHVLEQLFNNLSDYQADKMAILKENYLQARIKAEESVEQPGSIYTALVPNEKLPDLPHFSPIAEPGEMSDAEGDLDSPNRCKDFIGVFFKCSYKRFMEITDGQTYSKEYEAEVIEKNTSKKIMCRLVCNTIYVTKEKYLQIAAAQYGFDVPLIFSPYARRFAEIQFSEPVELGSVKQIVIKGLEKDIEATTLEKMLVWNVELKQKAIPELPVKIDDALLERMTNQTDLFLCNEYVIPGSSYTFKSVYKCKSNEWLLFDGIGSSRLAIVRKLSEDKLYVMHDANVKAEPIIRLLIHQPDIVELQKIGRTFQNYYNRTVFRKKRLYSIADIRYAVSGFRNNDIGITIDDRVIVGRELRDEQEIIDYYNEHCYYHYVSYRNLNESELQRSIPLRTGTMCCLTFYGNVWYTEDYARYVLAWLNEQYPELIWIGRWER